MDDNRSNGWDTDLTFTPGNWNTPRKFRIYYELDDTGKDFPVDQKERLIKPLRDGKAVGGNGVGGIKNTDTPTPNQFRITFDYKADYYNYFDDAKKATIQQAANAWASRIKTKLTGYTETRLTNTTSPFNTDPTAQITIPLSTYVDHLHIVVSSGTMTSGTVGNGGPIFFDSGNSLPRVGFFMVNYQGNFSGGANYFLALLTHELGHALGIIGFNSTGQAFFDITNNLFTGSYTRSANGGQNLPLNPSAKNHPADTISSIMSYGFIYTLNPPVPQTIDFALLADHGYSIQGIN
jgi:hypothetical protein